MKGFKLNRTEKLLPPTWSEYRDRWPSAVSDFKIGTDGWSSGLVRVVFSPGIFDRSMMTPVDSRKWLQYMV